MYFISNPIKHLPSSPCILTLYDKLVLLLDITKIILSVVILDAEYLF